MINESKEKCNCKSWDLSLEKQLYSFIYVLIGIYPDDDPLESKHGAINTKNIVVLTLILMWLQENTATCKT